MLKKVRNTFLKSGDHKQFKREMERVKLSCSSPVRWGYHLLISMAVILKIHRNL